MSEISSRGYAYPEKLCSTQWVADHLSDPNVRLIESNEDPLLYPSGHIPGAHEVDWTRDLNDQVVRDYLDRDAFTALMRRLGADETTTLVFYGDKNNWWATYALWVFELYGVTNTKIMDGGRQRWMDENRPFNRDKAVASPTSYEAPPRDDATERIFRDQVLAHVRNQGQLVDVRSPQEFTGERMHMPDYPNEGALRGGHIPGANNIPWAKALRPEDGTFLPADELRPLYPLNAEQPTVVYCRIGERSSHTWFVLKYLLGLPGVRNYDGSWTEWGNAVGVPVER